jgi:DNA (cytosine-5)-methyltransferase 1
LAIEKEPLRIEYRNKNLGHMGFAMDIRDYEPRDEHAADVLWTSPPCTKLSSASRSDADPNDALNYLYLESIKYCKIFKPKYFILENVTGILTHKSDGVEKSTFLQWRRDFEKIGYRTEFNVLNSKHFGVPQDRERVFMVGSIEGKKNLLPRGTKEATTCFGDIMEEHSTAECWNGQTYHTVWKAIARNSAKYGSPYGFTLIRKEDILPTLTCSFDGGATRKKLAVIDTTNEGVTYLRHPTVREGARAQGFPENWEFPESRTLAWNMIGDAVTSNVSRAIAEHLMHIEEGHTPPHMRGLVARRIPHYIRAADEPGRHVLNPMEFDEDFGEDLSTEGVDIFGKI